MKFIQPVEITAEYKITTPMFLGGAFPTEGIDAQQFRNASLKGALRFWWRALNWGRVLKANHGDEAAALKALHQREGELFGRASDGNDSVQSRVQLSSTLQGCRQQPAGPGLASLGYLLGIGLYRQKVLRPYLSDGTLQVTARFKPGSATADLESVKEALIALGLFGGLGSRARKGLGSLAIQHIAAKADAPYQFSSLQQVEHFIAGLDFSAPAHAPLTAFTCASRIDLSMQGTNPEKLLADIGKEQQLYRSFGRNGQVQSVGQDGRIKGEPARQNFAEDHDIAHAAASCTGQAIDIKGLPQRAVFGLPHNYHFSSLTNGDLNIAPAGEGRRSSPLLIHIHQLPNGESLAIQTLMPASFLPEKTEIEVKNPKRRHLREKYLVDYSVNYQVIHDYLDGFKQRKVLRHGK